MKIILYFLYFGTLATYITLLFLAARHTILHKYLYPKGSKILFMVFFISALGIIISAYAFFTLKI